MLKLLYFAWLRTKIGIAEERVSVPDGVTDVADLIGWLRGRGDG
ncbi:MAG: molybdopterin synthase sulfur carrier subunit, partial [Niveispirillum sp.]|nr:molybdopterin synthase sulfur carrier subunit [Niveispirillum sp.]